MVLGFTYDNNSWNHKALSTDSQWDQFDPFDSLEGIIQQVQDYLGIYPWIDTYDEFIEHFNNDSGWYVNYLSDFNVWVLPSVTFLVELFFETNEPKFKDVSNFLYSLLAKKLACKL